MCVTYFSIISLQVSQFKWQQKELHKKQQIEGNSLQERYVRGSVQH